MPSLRPSDDAQPEPRNAPITDEDYERLAHFHHVLRRFLRFGEQAARAAGLTPQQHQLLLAVRGFHGRDCVTVGELAERLQLRHNSTVTLADRCERAGLIRREQNPANHRQVCVHLTPQGAEALLRLTHMHRRELAWIHGRAEVFTAGSGPRVGYGDEDGAQDPA